MAFSRTRMAKAERSRAATAVQRDDRAVVGHPAFEQRGADRLTRQREALNARPLVTAQCRGGGTDATGVVTTR